MKSGSYSVGVLATSFLLLWIFLPQDGSGVNEADRDANANQWFGTDRRLVELGTFDIMSQSEVKVQFRLQNRSARVLYPKISSSCGCIVASEINELQPGASSLLEVELSLPVEGGRFKKSIFIVDRDYPDATPLMLSIAGQMLATPRLLSKPASVLFGTAKDSQVRRVLVRREDSSAVRVVSIDSPDYIEVTLNASTAEALELLVKSHLEQFDYAQSPGSINVVTDHPRFANLEIPVGLPAQRSAVNLRKSLFVSLSREKPAKHLELFSHSPIYGLIKAVEYEGDARLSVVAIIDVQGGCSSIQVSLKSRELTLPFVAKGVVELSFADGSKNLGIPLTVVVDR